MSKLKAEKLHQRVKTFIITCVGEDGYPLVKAVVPAKHRDSLDEIYFCTNTSSKFAQAVMKNPKASVYFYRKIPLLWQGCMLTGNMEIVTDIKVKERFWIDMFKGAYTEKAPTDPDFCVLKFTPIASRFYSNFKLEDFTF